jgi:hypothetical protein
MSRKRKNTYKNGKPDLLKSLASLDFNELDRLSKTVPMLLQSKLQSSMMSRDVEDVMKANLYLGSKTSDNGKLQSVFFDPQVWNDSGRDYLAQRGILPFSTLRRMGGIYLVRAIVNTRIEQIQNFLHFSDDEQKEGYTIRKKRGLFDPGDLSLSSKDKKKVEKIVEFLERGGNTDKWDNYDTLPDFIRKISFDSLTLDQLAFETTRNRMWELDRFKAVDASLVRFLLISAKILCRSASKLIKCHSSFLSALCCRYHGRTCTSCACICSCNYRIIRRAFSKSRAGNNCRISYNNRCT